MLLKQLDSNLKWFVSSGDANYSAGARLESLNTLDIIKVQGNALRLIGLLSENLEFLDQQPQALSTPQDSSIVPHSPEVSIDIPYAPDEEVLPPPTNNQKHQKYPFFGGKGELNSVYACFQMVSKHLEMPFRKEVVRRMHCHQTKRINSIVFLLKSY